MSNFGVHLGRLISRYPKRWEKLVVDGLTCPDVEKARIVEALARGRGRLLPRHHEWKPELPWLENAEAEHAKRPFHAVVASTNPRNQPFILLDDIDVTQPPPLWAVAHGAKVPRRAADMAGAAMRLLQIAKTVVFVDRNFSPKDRGFREALKAFLQAMLDRNGKCSATRIEYHTGDRLTGSDFTSLCSGFLPDLVPPGVTIKLVRWAYTDLHNRYILTELGGLQFGQGLDEAGPTEQQEDFVSLLGFEESQRLLSDYIGPKPPFGRDPVEVVRGPRTRPA
jgi:hypothetical protein